MRLLPLPLPLFCEKEAAVLWNLQMPGATGFEESELPVEEETGLETAIETGAEILEPKRTDDWAVSGRD
jgi:hypothetical protein